MELSFSESSRELERGMLVNSLEIYIFSDYSNILGNLEMLKVYRHE